MIYLYLLLFNKILKDSPALSKLIPFHFFRSKIVQLFFIVNEAANFTTGLGVCCLKIRRDALSF
jgi:hypothetical protein